MNKFPHLVDEKGNFDARKARQFLYEWCRDNAVVNRSMSMANHLGLSEMENSKKYEESDKWAFIREVLLYPRRYTLAQKIARARELGIITGNFPFNNAGLTYTGGRVELV